MSNGIALRFLRDKVPYSKGVVAVFAPSVAEILISRGIAEEYKTPPIVEETPPTTGTENKETEDKVEKKRIKVRINK